MFPNHSVSQQNQEPNEISRYSDVLIQDANAFLNQANADLVSPRSFISFLNKYDRQTKNDLISLIVKIYSNDNALKILETESKAYKLLQETAEYLKLTRGFSSRRNFLKTLGLAFGHISSGGLGKFATFVSEEITLGKELDDLLKYMLSRHEITLTTRYYHPGFSNLEIIDGKFEYSYALDLYYTLLPRTVSSKFITTFANEFNRNRPSIAKTWIDLLQEVKISTQELVNIPIPQGYERRMVECCYQHLRFAAMHREIDFFTNIDSLKQLVLRDAEPIAEFVANIPNDLRAKLLGRIRPSESNPMDQCLKNEYEFLNSELETRRNIVQRLIKIEKKLFRQECPFLSKDEMKFLRENAQSKDVYLDQMKKLAKALIILEKIIATDDMVKSFAE